MSAELKHTFSHVFKDGSRATLNFDFTGEPEIKTRFDIPPKDFKLIDNEYIKWRCQCFIDLFESLPPEVVNKVAQAGMAYLMALAAETAVMNERKKKRKKK